MAKNIKIKRGLDIPLKGKASAESDSIIPSLAGIVPDDFPGHTWKCVPKPGDPVAMGSPLLEDKETGKIKIASPVSGYLKEIRRGERRKILAVVVETGKTDNEGIPEFDLKEDPQTIRETLLQSGLWALIRQRPFDIVPDSEVVPRDIFITALDTAPLAPTLFQETDIKYIEKGLEILGKLTDKKPYIAVAEGSGLEFKNGETLQMQGPHPAGNVGVQIAAVNPVNKGETVLTMNVATLIRIGKLYLEKTLSFDTHVALTGEEFKNPHFVSTIIGADIKELIEGQLKEDNDFRIISGNVLTGIKVNPEDGFLRYPYYQITAIAEGADRDEFMGWASMNPAKYSIKRTFPAFLRGLSKPFSFDARIKGGRRAMILSGEYDKVFPFDIYPEYLLRAMQSGDIDRMEKLGIYEVAPEDFALPEFVDTSKQEFQQLARESLDKIRSEA